MDRLEELSDTPVLEYAFLAGIFSKTLGACKCNGWVEEADLRTCVLWLAGSLLLSNHQTPGAVAGMQMCEVSTATEEKEGRDTYLVISVYQHKKGRRLKQC